MKEDRGMIKLKEWPDDGSPARFEKIVVPVARILRQILTKRRRVIPQRNLKIKYSGLRLGKSERATCLDVDELLRPEQLCEIYENQGRDVVETIVGLAVQLGIEQGRRLERQNTPRIYLPSSLDLSSLHHVPKG